MTGTLSYRDIFYNHEVLSELAHAPSYIAGLSAAGLIGILLFIGTIGKSAQWPLHVWLPDAMEGPTPVSAMIHAATMVSAGVYMVIRTFPLLSAGFEETHAFTPPMIAMAFIGTFTALFAATIAVAQNDIKRVLAYSTISQLGFMIAALGIGGFVAATFHLVTHAFFKALLFLGSGSVIHGMEHGVLHTGQHIDPQDMFNMGGLRKKMPITFLTFTIGGFALAGFPLVTAGFWSKDEILADAWAHAPIVFVCLALAAHETTWTMTLPLVVLAVFAVGFGWLGIPEHFPGLGGLLPNWIHEFVGGTLLEHPEALPFSWIPLLTSLVVALGGLGLGWWVYREQRAGQADPVENSLGGLHTVLKNKYYFDEIYDYLFVKPAIWLSETFTSAFLDRTIIDGVLHFFGYITGEIGSFLRNAIDRPIINGLADRISDWVRDRVSPLLRTIQTGQVQQYMILALVSIAAFAAMFFLLFGGNGPLP